MCSILLPKNSIPLTPSPVKSPVAANELPRGDPSLPQGIQLSITEVTKYGR